jgi:hypothetical protein
MAPDERIQRPQRDWNRDELKNPPPQPDSDQELLDDEVGTDVQERPIR